MGGRVELQDNGTGAHTSSGQFIPRVIDQNLERFLTTSAGQSRDQKSTQPTIPDSCTVHELQTTVEVNKKLTKSFLECLSNQSSIDKQT